MPSVKNWAFKMEMSMKKLLALLLCISAPALAKAPIDYYEMNVQKIFYNKDNSVKNNTLNLVSLYIVRNKNLAVQDTINAIKTVKDFAKKNKDVEKPDAYGRNAIWYAAALSNNQIYDVLVQNRDTLKEGANPDVKSIQGPLAGYTARQLHDMTREQIDAKLFSETGFTPMARQSE